MGRLILSSVDLVNDRPEPLHRWIAVGLASRLIYAAGPGNRVYSRSNNRGAWSARGCGVEVEIKLGSRNRTDGMGWVWIWVGWIGWVKIEGWLVGWCNVGRVVGLVEYGVVASRLPCL